MKRAAPPVLLASILIGSTVAGPALGADRPRVAAVRAESPIRLDGRLDEVDWDRAPPVTAFLLIEVREGEAPSESTDVRVLFNDTHVYVGIRCANRNPGPVRASLAPRDQILDDDHVAIHFDTYRDFRRAYIFGVNPYGVQLDGILDGDTPDFTWDAVWDAEARLDAEGWTAEIAVPLRTLRFPAGGGVWGFWIRRQVTKNDEVCSWPLYRLGVAGDIMLQAGDLEGLEGLGGGGGVELQPYAASTRAELRGPGGGGGPGPWSDRTDTQFGADLRYGVTSTLTANLTANPDYSQVEADALQVDVNQRFPLFFPEKRPFFLEGAEIFNTLFRLVYTRRMADPAYGGKLTGKLGRWRVGAIAVRDEGGGSTEGIGAGSGREPAAEGYFGIGRVTYDIGENHNLGVLLTTHQADGYEGPVPAVVGFRAPGRSWNTVVSADLKLKLAKSLFFASQVAHSSARVDSVSDGGRLRGERFSDYLSTIAAWWNDGKRFALAYHDYLGSDFRADAGFLERVDMRLTGYEAYVTFRPENAWLRYVAPTSNGNYIEDTRGMLQERRLAGAIRWGFQKQTFLETRLAHVDERWLSRIYDRWRYILSATNSLWRPLALGLDVVLEDGIFYAPTDSASYLGWLESYALRGTLRPSPRLTSELTATRSRFSTARGGAEVYDIWLLGAKTTYQFTRRLYMRLYPQYDTFADHLDADLLLAYVIHPGSVLYLGLTGDLDKMGDRHHATQRTVFVKASYVFQG
jgi:hypothetical protein